MQHLCIFLHFSGHFPGGPGLAGTKMSTVWMLLQLRVMEMVVTTGAKRWAKLQSQCYHKQTNTQLFYSPDALPVTQPTVSEHLPIYVSYSARFMYLTVHLMLLRYWFQIWNCLYFVFFVSALCAYDCLCIVLHLCNRPFGFFQCFIVELFVYRDFCVKLLVNSFVSYLRIINIVLLFQRKQAERSLI